jgi:hypothetical protein
MLHELVFACMSHALEHLLSLENVVDLRSVVVCTCSKMFFSWLKEPSRPGAVLTLNIEVDDQRTFTTRERIIGKLTIKPLIDTPFDKLEIKLQGISRTYGRRIVPHAPHARTVTTAHRFLELTQPDLAQCFPDDKVFRSGRHYTFPFEFAIPDRMLPATCRHVVESPGIHELHTSMPPSLGDRQAGEGNDYAPRRVSVKYRILARAFKAEGLAGYSKMETLALDSKRIQFMPSDVVPMPVPEVSNHIDPVGRYIPLRKLWVKQLGNLVVTSVQASTFRVQKVDSGVWHSDLSGQVKLELMFIPAFDGAEPPKQIELSGIFRTETTSAVSPLVQLPSTDPWLGPELDKHTAPSVILSSQAVGKISWTRVSAAGTESGEKCPSYEAMPSCRHPERPCPSSHYSAEMVASLAAAVGCSLVPTFHSCLISRTYSIDLRLSTRTFTFGSFSNMRLKVPVLVAYEHADDRRDSAMFSAETTEADAMRQCSLGVRPDERFAWEEVEAPPSYELSST